MRPWSISLAFVLDLFLGDPEGFPHPVVGMGRLIKFLEDTLWPHFPQSKRGQIGAGLVTVLLVTGVSGGLGLALLKVAGLGGVGVQFCLETFICYQILGTKSLEDHSLQVYARLAKKNLQGAQTAVGRIVGRDSSNLTAKEIIKATVETVAENTSDGVIAPLLYMFIGGAPLGLVYKAINTMDSMIGYNNEQYQYYGRPAAYLDDIVNWIPARLTGILIVVAALLGGYDGAESWRILKRDRKHHNSPNGGHPESAVAGALGIELGGDSLYLGRVVTKPTLGDATRRVAKEDILYANQLLLLSSLLALGIGVVILL